MSDLALQCQRMASGQIHARGVRVLAAMGKMRREAFVPEPMRDLAYADRPLPIAAKQTISQLYVVAYMIEALALEGEGAGDWGGLRLCRGCVSGDCR